MQTPRKGFVVIPNGVSPDTHELKTAQVLSRHGLAVEFLAPNNKFMQKTPDITIDGVEWEMKSPIGTTHRTISHILKKGAKQSKNIVLDSSRTRINDSLLEKMLRKDLASMNHLKNIKLVTKDGRVIDIN